MSYIKAAAAHIVRRNGAEKLLSLWKSLNEISEKDRAFLFSYGLIQVQNFYQTIVGWGDEISYPGK